MSAGVLVDRLNPGTSVSRSDQTRQSTHTTGPCAFIRRYKACGRGQYSVFFISCARACTVTCEVSTEAQFFADCKLHILTRLTSFGCQQFLEFFLASGMSSGQFYSSL